MAITKKPKVTQDDAKAEAFINASSTPAPTPAPKASGRAAKKPVALRLDGDLLARIDAAAAARGISRNAWISWQCAEGLKDE